jgi:transposase InsO family protein
MRKLEMKSVIRPIKKKPDNGNVSNIAPNILKREFKTEEPNKKWVTDITEFSLFGVKVYLATILDLYNGEIISYNISRRVTVDDLIKKMLLRGFAKLPNKSNLLLHSDQGSQYTSNEYCRLLKQKGIQQSMSRRGNCYDNAVMENFFGHLKCELFYLKKFNSVEHLIEELHRYIYYYNNERIKDKLNWMSPINYRLAHLNISA